MTSFRGANGNFIFLDTETGGLNSDEDELVEVSYAINDDEITTLVLPHRPWRIRPDAAATNHYHERDLGNPALWCSPAERSALLEALTGATLVGANPAFDAAFLRRHFGWQPWHYRMADVEAMAWGLGISRDDGTMPGLIDVVTHLNAKGYAVPIPDHTGRGDADATRAAFHALVSLSATYRTPPAKARA